jgi:ribose transport system ATP-binding protein
MSASLDGAASAGLAAPAATTMLTLQVSGLTKAFAGQVALDDVSLTVGQGEVHALLGENGSGKSTFIKLLSGYHRPDRGEVVIGGNGLAFGRPSASYELGCRFIHQDLGLVSDLSVFDNLFLSTGFPQRLGTVRSRQARATAIADLKRVDLDVDLNAPVSSLTAAQRTGVAVARALRPDVNHPTHLLVLDEPTATLPATEVNHLLQIVSEIVKSGVSVVYVTHRLDEVFQIADNVTVLRDGKHLRTQPVAGVTRRQIVSLLVGDEFEEIAEATSNLPPSAEIPFLEVNNIVGDNLAGVSFVARPGEIVGVAGITGSGRESLLGAIFGAVYRSSASEVLAGGRRLRPNRPDAAVAAGIAYLPSDRKRLSGIMELSARENMTVAGLKPLRRGPGLSRRRERREVKRWIAELSVRPADKINRKLEFFSGGNQQKILFAKWLRLKPQAFLLDEPTQGVDVAAKAELHRQLTVAAASGATVIVSSSDGDELAALCTRVIVLRQGRVVGEIGAENLTVSGITRACFGTNEIGVSR